MSLVVRIPLLFAGTICVLECSGAPPAPEKPKASCSAKFNVSGNHGSALHLIPTGWKNENGYADVLVEGSALLPQMGGRAYFADSCTPGKYNNTDYMRANLLGKTMRFSTHLEGAGCGCNAAFYLTSMGHNKEVSECFDHYCDANNVCGQTCAEIDIMEANQHAWHSTLHTAADSDGSASGFGGGGNGWNGPRDWSEAEYGVGGSCIDTAKQFDVAVSFPLDEHGTLVSMEVTLSQKGHNCKLQARVDDYAGGFKELTHALLDGMTPIISYWADDDMLWMDGKGADGRGPCREDSAAKCADSVKLFDFSIEDLVRQGHDNLQNAAAEHDKNAVVKSQPGEDSSQESDASWWPTSEQSMGTDQWNDNEQAKDMLMQKDELATGALRGAMDSGRVRLRGFIWVVVVVVGLVMLVSVTLVLRRAPRPAATADVAGDDPAEAARSDNRPAVVRRDSLSRLRTAFSKGSFGQLDGLGGSTPTPMLQQPPSNQNLLAFGGV